jgi:hypothetical protein
MKFKPVDVMVPKPIQQLVQQIVEIEPNSCLAGGCLSDLYMNKPFKDVDIFINYSADVYVSILKQFQLSHMSIYSDPSQEHYFKERLVTVKSFDYNGYPVQLIFTTLGKNIVQHFDFRFREFYYDGTNVFASPEALDDIANKQFVFGVTDNPLGSFRRLISFEKKYSDFTIEPEGFHRLQSFFNQHVYLTEKIENILSTNETITEKALRSNLSTKRIFQKFELRHPRYENFAKYCLFHHFTRFQADQLYAKNDFFTKTVSHTFTDNYFDREVVKTYQTLKQLFDNNRLRFLGLLTPLDMQKLQEAFHRGKRIDFPTIHAVLTEYRFPDFLSSFVEKYNNHLKVLEQIQKRDRKKEFSMEFSARVSNDIVLHTFMNLDDYLHNRVIKCSINLPSEDTYSNLIFNQETGEQLYNLFYKPLSDIYQQLIQEKCFSVPEDVFNELSSEFCY